MKTPLALTLLFLTFSLQGQNSDDEILELTKLIADHGRMEDRFVGMIATKSPQFERFEKLKKVASQEQLLSLLKHKSPVVKGYAAWGLVDTRYNDLGTVFAQLIESGETVKSTKGCLTGYDQIAAELYQRLESNQWSNKLSEKDRLHNRNQLTQLYSIILRRDTVDFMLSHAFYKNRANPDNYDIIKKWALEKLELEALVALAEYKREEDISNLKALGTLSFKAIANFTHPDFKEFLTSTEPESFNYDYFLAVSAYKDQFALSTLEKLYKTYRSPEHTDESWDFGRAIIDNYIPQYRELVLQFTEDHGIIQSTLAIRFMEEIPQLAAESFLKSLSNNNHIVVTARLSDDFGTSEKVLGQILNHVKKETGADLTELCATQIRHSDFTKLEVYTDFARLNGLKGVIPEVLEKLSKKNGAFETFHLTQTLLSFKDRKANQKLSQLLSESRKNWDWGNWSKSFQELFEEYDFIVN